MGARRVSAPRRGDAVVSGAEGFTAFYAEHAARVLGYLRARGADDPEAMTQEVFVGYFSHSAPPTGGEEGARALLYSIAHARLVDQYRQRARRPVLSPYVPEDDVRTTASAEEDALSRTGEYAALDLLARLPDEYREVIALRVIVGVPISECAQIMRRSEGAVKQLQRRALERLRAELGGRMSDERPA